MHDQSWTVSVYGGNATALIRYRLDEAPEDRDLEALLAKHDATDVAIDPPAVRSAEVTA